MKTHKKNIKCGRKTKKIIGGKTISSNKPVKITYKEKEILCEICSSNNYTENTGTISKSKVRQGVGNVLFGEAAEVLDNTSVIIYTCNTCGLCKIVRNKEPLSIQTKEI
jgi:hypothetical protein